MDMNSYLVEWLAKERLSELRTSLERQQLAASLRQPSPLRAKLGSALISLGRRLQAGGAAMATHANGASAAS